jgi:hypothetical protein
MMMMMMMMMMTVVLVVDTGDDHETRLTGDLVWLGQATDDDRGFIPGTTTTITTTANNHTHNSNLNPNPTTTTTGTTAAPQRRPTVGEFILGRGLDGDAVIGDDTEPTFQQLFTATFRSGAAPGEGELVTVPSVPSRFRPRNSSSFRKDESSSGSSSTAGGAGGQQPLRKSSSGVTPRDSDSTVVR